MATVNLVDENGREHHIKCPDERSARWLTNVIERAVEANVVPRLAGMPVLDEADSNGRYTPPAR